MRAYYIPAAAGVLLIVSAFVPWMIAGDVSLGGVPDPAGWWILGLGVSAVLLSGLSLWTRKNSRHPLLLVGLAAIRDHVSRIPVDVPHAQGLGVGSSSGARDCRECPGRRPTGNLDGHGHLSRPRPAAVVLLFGLTIVVKRAPRAYAEDETMVRLTDAAARLPELAVTPCSSAQSSSAGPRVRRARACSR